MKSQTGCWIWPFNIYYYQDAFKQHFSSNWNYSSEMLYGSPYLQNEVIDIIDCKFRLKKLLSLLAEGSSKARGYNSNSKIKWPTLHKWIWTFLQRLALIVDVSQTESWFAVRISHTCTSKYKSFFCCVNWTVWFAPSQCKFQTLLWERRGMGILRTKNSEL